MDRPTILSICGALREASTNRLLLAEARRAFGEANHIEANLRLPLYDGDVEEAGMPAEVLVLVDQIRAADGVMISTPEYNKALSGVLKNALDWISRVPGRALAGKPVAIMSAADGRSGGERAQASLRLALVPHRPRVVPGPDLFVAGSRSAFDGEGRLMSEQTRTILSALMDALKAEMARA